MAVEKLTPERRRQRTARRPARRRCAGVRPARLQRRVARRDRRDGRLHPRGDLQALRRQGRPLLRGERSLQRAGAPRIQRSPRDHRPGRQSPGRGGRGGWTCTSRTPSSSCSARSSTSTCCATPRPGPGRWSDAASRRVASPRSWRSRTTALGIHDADAGRRPGVMFLVTSDGFTMASLIDPEIARLYGTFLEIFVRGAWGDAFDAVEPPDRARDAAKSDLQGLLDLRNGRFHARGPRTTNLRRRRRTRTGARS